MPDPQRPVIRTPDQRLRVFVSSTLQELVEERAAAREAVTKLRLAPVMFELGARPHPPRELYRAYLDQSHIFIGLYWQRYGWVAPGETMSGLEDEYRLSGNRPKLIYIKAPAPEREPRLKELLDRIKSDDTASYKSFSTPAELRELVENDLAVLLTERFEMAQVGEAPLAVEAAESRRNNLPAQLTPFIGREKEVAAVRDLLRRDDVHLVTVTGPGGTGKTRLGLQAAAGLLDDFEDGVFFVPLAPIRDPNLVPPTLAQTLDVRESGTQPLMESLKQALRDKHRLLLLDNFEQVVIAAPVVADLLTAATRLKALVTSRELLHLQGEHDFPVPPLALPDARHLPTLAALGEIEAIRLFVDRAQWVKADFVLTAENAPAVAEICQRLDGLPLAIELAAARVRLMPPQAMLSRLSSRLKLLTGGARDLPARQQTLRDTIAWSYEMLRTGEQRLFELLSVFSGATLEALEAVTGQIKRFDEMGVDILEDVSSLIDKSLIRQADQGSGEPRLLMLETIREYAAAQLEEDPEFSAAARRAHATYFADLTRGQWEHLTGDGRETALVKLTSDIENIRTAWRYWVAQGDLEELGKLTDSLWLLNDARGWYHATVELTTDLLKVLSSTASTPERASEEIMLQTSLARALMAIRGYTQEVEQAYTRALELCQGEGEIPQLFPVLRGLSTFYNYRCEFEKGARIGERILSLAEHLNDVDMRVEGHLVLGSSVAFLDNLRLGLDHLEKGIAAYDPNRQRSRRLRLGTNPGVACLTISALVLWMLGFPDRALKRASEAVALAQKLDHPFSKSYALFHTGLLHLWLREADIAQKHARALLDIAEEYDFEIWRAVGLCLRGAALAAMGSAAEGLTLIDRGLATYQGLKTPPLFWSLLLFLQAGAYGLANRPADGLSRLDQAIETAAQSSGNTVSAEFCRLKGDLLLALSPDNLTEAESWFQQAVDIARKVQAPMLELRAALRLSWLWREQGKVEQARKLLSDAYATLTEGFTTADLRGAKALLEDLA